MVDKHVIGLKFLGTFVSVDLGSRSVIPCVNHCGFVSEFFPLLDIVSNIDYPIIW